MIDPFLENVYPDLTVGAIAWRRFAPNFIVKLVQARIHHSPYNIGDPLGHL